MTDLDTLRAKWTEATADLAPGVQRAFVDVLTNVKDELVNTLVYGADYSKGGACLVNSTRHILSSTANDGTTPSDAFGKVVRLYDEINREFRNRDINLDNHVSPLAAEIMLQWFAPLKPMPMETIAKESHFKGTDTYVEPTDQEMLEALTNMLSEPAPVEEQHPWADYENMVQNEFAAGFDLFEPDENF